MTQLHTGAVGSVPADWSRGRKGLILSKDNISLGYVISVRMSFVLCPDYFARLSDSHQAGGTEVGSSHLPLLDLQWLLAGLAASDHICPSSHTADSAGCPSPALQVIFFHMFEIFCRLHRKSSRQLH